MPMYAREVLKNTIRILTETRLKKKISHGGLAAKANVSRMAISYIESGKRSPSLFLCINIARALDVNLSAVLKEAEKKASTPEKQKNKKIP